MRTMPLPLTRDLVLIGGGHAHALILRRWAMAPLPGARLTLIDPNPVAAYSGMLPGHIAGHYPRAALEIDLVRLARFAGARLILGPATGIDRAARRVMVPGRPPVAYDVLSVDIGITTAMPELPGFAEHGIAAKPLEAFATRWQAFVDSAGALGHPPRVVVIGGGVAGVELALAAAHRLREHRATVTVLESEAEALSGIGVGTRRRLLTELGQAGVTLRLDTRATQVTADSVLLGDGSALPCDLAIGVAGARPHPWLAETGLALTDGFIDIGPTLASTTDPAIFAAGDCAHLTHAPRPKAGVYAVRAAPVLLHNLKAALSGTAPRNYHPQRDYLKLISTGGKAAVADKWRLPLAGEWIWRWKDRIDRRFMAMLQDLPAMPPAAVPAQAATGLAEELAGKGPLCGGCAAKVGGADLGMMLASLPRTERGDVLRGAGDDAAVLRGPSGVQVITTDHLRAFTEDPVLMTRIAAIHALGDVWAMGAEPQVALAQVILPRLSQRLQARTLAEIMATAAEVMAEVGAEIVGGHTSIGAELTLGFTLTGAAPRATGLGGAQPGDALLLTKPLGTGVILAAEMQHRAPGAVVAAALASMARLPARDTALLAPLAHAMTDVTGFGLAGHLLAILDASGLSAELSLSALPVLPGAEALLEQGLRATLHEANRSGAARVAAPETPRGEMLFDPQTAGGLLATLPPRDAEEVLSALRNAGVDAAIIGRLHPGPVAVSVVGDKHMFDRH